MQRGLQEKLQDENEGKKKKQGDASSLHQAAEWARQKKMFGIGRHPAGATGALLGDALSAHSLSHHHLHAQGTDLLLPSSTKTAQTYS